MNAPLIRNESERSSLFSLLSGNGNWHDTETVRPVRERMLGVLASHTDFWETNFWDGSNVEEGNVVFSPEEGQYVCRSNGIPVAVRRSHRRRDAVRR